MFGYTAALDYRWYNSIGPYSYAFRKRAEIWTKTKQNSTSEPLCYICQLMQNVLLQLLFIFLGD